MLLAAPCALASCGNPANEQAAAPATVAATVGASDVPSPVVQGLAPLALAGEYRVAGVDGADIDLPYGITASISDDRIHVVADCVNLAWDYRVEGAALVTERAAVESCARGLAPAEEALVAAFDAAVAVGRTSTNGLEFSGGGHTVILFGQ